MFKGFIGSLIAAIVLFAAGGITVALYGTNPWQSTHAIEELEWNDGGYGAVDETFTGERKWYFGRLEGVRHISVNSSSAKTYIAPSSDETLTVYAQSNEWKKLTVRATYSGGVLDITVDGSEFGNFIFNAGNSGTVMITVPDMIYDSLSLQVGSGTLSARGIAAELNDFDVGSGTFEYEQKQGFSAELIQLDMGSGSSKIANAACDTYNILMGSGSFNISGLTGSGRVDIGSGSGTAEFFEVNGGNLFDLGSGKLSVYIPGNTRADLFTQIGSGIVTVDCCGVSERITGDQQIALNGGSGSEVVSITADLGSGKVELLDASKYQKPDMFSVFPIEEAVEDGFGIVSGVTITDADGYNSGAEYIGSVATIVPQDDVDLWFITGDTALCEQYTAYDFIL